MGIYLIDHPPLRGGGGQFRSPRRGRPTGLVVIHTAENIMDSVGPDTGAEAVADFIRRRSDPGSYHDLCDSDSALQLVRYSDEAYHDGTGSNPYALSISFACKTSDWRRMSPRQLDGFLRSGAEAFARQQAWLRSNGYPMTPLRRITKPQSDVGQPGCIAHGDRDPGRRSDPGIIAPNLFPWERFFELCAATMDNGPGPTPGIEEDDDMPHMVRNAVTGDLRVFIAGKLIPVRTADSHRELTREGLKTYDLDPNEFGQLLAAHGTV